MLTNRLLWLGIALGLSPSPTCAFASPIVPRAPGGAARASARGCARAGRRRGIAPCAASTSRDRVSVPQVARSVRLRHPRASDARHRVDLVPDDRDELGRARPAGSHPAPDGRSSCSIRWWPCGIPLVPTTARVIGELTGPLSAELSRWVIIPLLIVFFAGELVWRERDAGLGEITDAMPGSEWVPFLGKFLGLGLVLVVFMALLMAAGMLAQVMLGYQDFEIGLYLKILFGLQLPEYLLFAVLALVVHVLVDQKYVGHLVAILAYVFIALLRCHARDRAQPARLRRRSGWSYTEMRGFGPSLGPWLWFKLYWAAWALLLAVAARLLWVRGKESGLGVRLQLARRRFTRPTAWTAAAAAVLILALGGFIFYNTNVLNEYLRRLRHHGAARRVRAALRALREYPAAAADGDQPARRDLSRAAGGGDPRHLPPGERQRTSDRLHPRGHRARRSRDRSGRLRPTGRARRRRRGARPPDLRPGEAAPARRLAAARLRGACRAARLRQPRRRRLRGGERQLLHERDWFPAIGYQRQSRAHRAPQTGASTGSLPRPCIPSLYDVEGRETCGARRGIAFEAVVGTDEDQVAVAPGALRRTWTEGGRRYFHYSTDAPIGSEWAFFSADYAVHEGTVERRRDPDLPSPGAHREPGPHDAKRAGLAGLLHQAVRALSVPPPQRRRASRRPARGCTPRPA